MKKEVFSLIRKELAYIGMIFLVSLAIFKIAFNKSSLSIILRSVVSIFWVFVFPGYFIMLYWREKLEFLERFAIGILTSAGLTGILSYYFGLFGLNVKYHLFLLPAMIIVSGIIINLFGLKRSVS